MKHQVYTCTRLPRHEGSTLIDLTSSYLLTHEMRGKPHILVSDHNGISLFSIPCKDYDKERYPRDGPSAPDDLVVNGSWLQLNPYAFRSGSPPVYLPRRALKVQVEKDRRTCSGFVLRGRISDCCFLLRLDFGAKSIVYLCSSKNEANSEEMTVQHRSLSERHKVYGRVIASSQTEDKALYGLCHRLLVVENDQRVTLYLDGCINSYNHIKDYRIRYNEHHYTILLVREDSYYLLQV